MNIDWEVILSVAKSYADSKNNADYDANNGWDVESWHGFYVDSMISQIKKLLPPSPTPEQGEKDAVKMSGYVVTYSGFTPPNKNHVVIEVRGYENYFGNRIKQGCVVELLFTPDENPAQQPTPLPALTTDEEAAEKYVSIEWYPDYVAKGEAEQSKQSRKDFLAGCTHVRSQQQEDSHEKEIMMQAFNNVREIFERRAWIMEGRGSYRYDDDHYKEEVRCLYEEFDTIQKDTWKNIKSKSFEYRKKIIEEYLKSQQPVDAVALCKKMAGLLNYLVKNDYIDTHTDEAKSYVDQTTALFSGSQASNQREEQDWKAAGLRIMNELYMKHRFFLRDLDVSNEDKRLFLTELGISSEFVEQH